MLMVAVSINKFDIVILAAGVGRRLRPLTLLNPKPLVKVNGESIISRLISEIPEKSIKSMSVVVGYRGSMIENCIRKMNLPYGVKFYHNSNYDSTHCASSLAMVEGLLSNGILLFNSDVVFIPGIFKSIIKRSLSTSFVVSKKKDANFSSDLQKIVSTDGIIEQWSLKIDGYTSEVIGPVFIDSDDGIITVSYTHLTLPTIYSV